MNYHYVCMHLFFSASIKGRCANVFIMDSLIFCTKTWHISWILKTSNNHYVDDKRYSFFNIISGTSCLAHMLPVLLPMSRASILTGHPLWSSRLWWLLVTLLTYKPIILFCLNFLLWLSTDQFFIILALATPMKIEDNNMELGSGSGQINPINRDF